MVGVIVLYFSGRFLVDPIFAKKYIVESPKVYILKKIFGTAKTMIITKYFFAPFGIIIGLFLTVFGLVL